MEIVLRETDRLNRLITDFLHYARPGPQRPEAVSLRDCVDELFEMLAGCVPESVELRAEVPAGLGVRADPAQLRQVLWNLALNGCQAMPEGGRMCIGAAPVVQVSPQEALPGDRNEAWEEKSARVEITVRDHGVGIPRDAMDHVFEPFFTTKAGGTGLGLATVHRIVQDHGGSIRVESRDGQGSVFRVRLPGAEVSS
jgi:two-component system sensor histidine kinase PilS (NtrC family)